MSVVTSRVNLPRPQATRFRSPVAFLYVAIASERTPAYEAWGIATKALQVLLLIALVYVALRHPGRPAARRTDERTLSRA